MSLLSPGVYIEEQDVSSIVPTVSNNVSFFAGDFTKGPVDQPYVITNKIELETIFGQPTDTNYNQWFQCYKFFDYANQLVVTRGYESTSGLTLTTDVTGLDRRAVYTTHASIATTEDTVDTVYSVTINEDFAMEVSVGDFVSIDGIEELAEITDITYTAVTGETILELTYDTATGDPVAAAVNSVIYLYSIDHLNGGTHATARGDLTAGVPDNENAIDSSLNVDTVINADEVNPNRIAYSYDLIKNNDEWDYFYSQGGANSLRTFATSSKLKFFSKTPTTETVEIAIANSLDFTFTNSENYAIAFQEASGDLYENTYLTNLFQYYPTSDQIAIAIKQGTNVETFIVSFDPASVDGNNKSNYIETVINEQSALVYVLENEALVDMPASYLVCDRHGWDLDADGKMINGSVNQDPTDGTNSDGIATETLTVQGGRSPIIGVGALTDAYFTVEDKESYEIDVIIGNEFVDDTYDNMNIAINLAETRKDCIAFVGARYSDTVGKKSGIATNALVDYITEADDTRGDSVKPIRSMFASFFGNYFRIYDKFNKKFRWINCAGDMAGIRCDVSSNQNAWWVSAGMKRGIIRNIDKMAFSPSQPQRDTLYKNGINPTVAFPGTGNLVWGNKTMHAIASSFDRINVRNLFNTLERAMSKAARNQVFEFNDSYTRNAILSMFNPYLATIKAGRGVTDYLVVCDETNNTADIISRNELRVDIYIKPNYAAEMITLTFTNVGTRSFASVVGA